MVFKELSNLEFCDHGISTSTCVVSPKSLSTKTDMRKMEMPNDGVLSVSIR